MGDYEFKQDGIYLAEVRFFEVENEYYVLFKRNGQIVDTGTYGKNQILSMVVDIDKWCLTGLDV